MFQWDHVAGYVCDAFACNLLSLAMWLDATEKKLVYTM